MALGPAFENKKYTAYDRFIGNGPYGEIPTKKKTIRTQGFTLRLPCYIIKLINAFSCSVACKKNTKFTVFLLSSTEALTDKTLG